MLRSLLLTLSIVGMCFAGPASAKTASQGELVLAVWGPDGFMYPGRVAAKEGTKLKIAYYDGDVGVVAAKDTRVMNWKVGTQLQCNWKNKGKYFPGKIAKKQGEALFIHYDDGDKEELGIGRCRSK